MPSSQVQRPIRHSNTSQGQSRPSFQRTPLRAVDNNATLLKSPGPLESMLKTTTETGDIGIFTIGANLNMNPPTPAHRRPRQPTLALADVPSNHSVHSRRHHDRDYSQDDRMRLPSSYRDTTSEILSLYGSEAHHSRTFTPSNNDAQRSQSFTTCSSRHIPSQMSSATLQSLSSTTALQRPRSPFPYPTHLKRSGTRPASPAITDNGAVGYAKMADIDRSYKVCNYERTYHLPNSYPSVRFIVVTEPLTRTAPTMPCHFPCALKLACPQPRFRRAPLQGRMSFRPRGTEHAPPRPIERGHLGPLRHTEAAHMNTEYAHQV